VSEHGHYESYRSRVRRDIEAMMADVPDDVLTARDDVGRIHRLDEGVHVLAEIAEVESKKFGYGYRLRDYNPQPPAPDSNPDDPDDPDADDYDGQGQDLLADDTDPNEGDDMAAPEKTPAEIAAIKRQGAALYQPDAHMAGLVRDYMSANPGTSFQDSLKAAIAQDPSMWRVYSRWVVERKRRNDRTPDALKELGQIHAVMNAPWLTAAEIEGSLDNAAALARATSVFMSEHDGEGLAGIDAARSYLRVKRPDLFRKDDEESDS
jgi:hypothetical protein